jgi:sporulation protein YlmC with PRC-barrel domain
MESTNSHGTSSAALRTLEDAELEVARADEDIRSRKVCDREGHEIGKVDALLIDDAEKRIRFMRIASGGFLGLGKTTFLLPIDAIKRIDADVVHVDQRRDQLASAPPYDPELVDRDEYLQRLYSHYGYSPYWTLGYTYPPFPFYPPPPLRRS